MRAKRSATPLPALLLLISATTAQAELSANIGWASDYWFRGLFQSDSSASGGLFEQRVLRRHVGRGCR